MSELTAANKTLHEQAREIVLLEGHLLDRREWDRWLDLYDENATYWVPAWKDEYTLTDDPQRELSLIYYPNRAGLEDRVFRIRTNKSLASIPLPRTCHITSVTLVAELAPGEVQVDANWVVHIYRFEKAHSFFGQQTHVIGRVGEGLKILRRKTIVNNDTIPDVLDVYCI